MARDDGQFSDSGVLRSKQDGCKAAVILSGMGQFRVPRIVKTQIAHPFWRVSENRQFSAAVNRLKIPV
jgi:hypothetical protein